MRPRLRPIPPLAHERIVFFIVFLTGRRRGVGVLGALILVALAARAEAGGARIRWSASVDPRVTGYRVYMRQAGAVYGAPLDAGRPTAAADGSLAYVVSGLTTGKSYYFAVSAYTAAPVLESRISQEIVLGSINPCTIDRCTTPTSCDIRTAADGSSCDDGLFCNGIAVCQGGVCTNGPAPSCSDGVACTVDHCDEALARCVHVAQPGCCLTNADCVDTDPCTTAEHCAAGACVSLATICPASSCAAAFCDPQFGCGLMPTPDGVNCDEFCDVLVSRRFTIRNNLGDAAFKLRASFQPAEPLDPSGANVSLEVADMTGAMVYGGVIPGALVTSNRARTKFAYKAARGVTLLTGGISAISLKVRNGVWTLNARGAATPLIDALGQAELALTVRFDGICARDTQLSCAGDPMGSTICR
jgi:hypothetical protein